MLIDELLNLVPDTTPIRIYKEADPRNPIVPVICTDSLNKYRNLPFGPRAKIQAVSSRTVEGSPYLVITIKETDGRYMP